MFQHGFKVLGPIYIHFRINKREFSCDINGGMAIHLTKNSDVEEMRIVSRLSPLQHMKQYYTKNLLILQYNLLSVDSDVNISMKIFFPKQR